MTDADRDDALMILLAWMDWPLEEDTVIELPSGGLVDLLDFCDSCENPRRCDLIPVGGQDYRVSEIVESCKGDKRPLSPGLAEHGIHLASIMQDGEGRVMTYDLLHYFELAVAGLDSDEHEFRAELDRARMFRRLAVREN